MFQIPKFFSLPIFSSSSRRSINLPAPQITDIETSTDRRARTLKHLLKANHANFSIIYNNLRYHNHTPHVLGAAYLLGATSEHLGSIYDDEAKGLEGWKDAPGEVTGGDWREYLGRKEYQRAFVDFFEDELVQHNYDWKALLNTYLFEGDEPLANNLLCGLAHPVIHLGYAFELSSQTVAVEGLAMTCCFYDDTHKYFDDPKYTQPPKSGLASSDPLELLNRLHDDERLNDFKVDMEAEENVDVLISEKEDIILEYWNAWTLTGPSSDPTLAFQKSQEAAVALLVGTYNASTPGSRGGYDFFLCHVLTSSHAIRTLLPLIPAKFELSLVRQWWFFTITTYISMMRPKIDTKSIHDADVAGKDWKLVTHLALTGKHNLDAHYVKALRSMKEAAATWGDDKNDAFYLKAAVKFGTEFGNW